MSNNDHAAERALTKEAELRARIGSAIHCHPIDPCNRDSICKNHRAVAELERSLADEADALVAENIKLEGLCGGALAKGRLLEHDNAALRAKLATATEALTCYSEICDCPQKGIREPHNELCHLQRARAALAAIKEPT